MTLATGTKLGSYEIVSPLGAGGMGEVYRARDANLKRDVAIKVLPESLAKDADALARFEREALAVAALSHPNILAIFDFGKHEGVAFAVMELLEGETLRDKLQERLIPQKQALDYALQIAKGLSAAHGKGIVHRDLKPENLFVTMDGHLKILDFGLAKQARAHGDDDTSAPTEEQHTEPGTVMGTVGYMSPEQVKGLAVDHRSDIFSFGTILYELLSRNKAFKRDSAVETMSAILKEEPPELSGSGGNVPPALDHIVRHCLEKSRDDRFQSAKDIVFALSEASGPAAASSAPRDAAARGRGRRRTAGLAGAGLILLAIAALLWPVPPKTAKKTAAGALFSMKPITTSGIVIEAAISPDGNYVSYVESAQNEQSLWFRQVAGGTALRLIPARRVEYWGLVFSGDGTKIVFSLKSDAESVGAIYEIPTLGGTPRKLLEGTDSTPAISPDGKKFAWLRAHYPTPEESALLVANVDGTGSKVLATRRWPEAFLPLFFAGPSWSPDGARIATSVFNSGELHAGKIVAIRLDAGSEERIADTGWDYCAQVAWLPETDGLVAIAKGSQQPGPQVWFVPYPKGTPRPITNDLLEYRIVNLTRDGRSLLTVAMGTRTAVWLQEGEARPRKATSSKIDGIFGLCYAPDGRVVYTSVESSAPGLWIMNADGTDRRPITNDDNQYFDPVVTSEGTVFATVRTASDLELRSFRLDGSRSRTVLRGAYNRDITVSPDGRWIVHVSVVRGVPRLFRTSVEGGASRSVTEYETRNPAFSPDSSRISFYYFDPKDRLWRIGIVATDGSGPMQTLEPAAAPSISSKMKWSWRNDGLLLNTMPGDLANVWFQPLGGGPTTKMTNFDEQQVFDFAVSAGGKSIAVARGTHSRDAVLLTGFR